MRGRVSKNKRIARNVKVTEKKYPKDGMLETPVAAKPKRQKKNRKDSIDVPFADVISEKTEDFETPFKGFRPFDLTESLGISFSQKLSSDDPIMIITSNMDLIQKIDEPIPIENQPKIFQASEPPEIWCKGIENITYKPTEFDFEGFPIQY